MTIICQRSGASSRSRLGTYFGPPPAPLDQSSAFVDAVRQVRLPLAVVRHEGCPAVATAGQWLLGEGEVAPPGEGGLPLEAFAEALPPERFGDPTFRAEHRLRFNYVVGAMANGIASTELVVEAARAGLLAFFGAGGLGFEEVSRAIGDLRRVLLTGAWGVNLIHSPAEPALEDAVSRLFLHSGVRCASASAYMRLTLPVVRYRLAGLKADSEGRPVAAQQVLAKVSRVEVARQFWSPAPAAMIDALRAEGTLNAQQAELAGRLPVARDITVEADSGGHTDNRPALTLLPTFAALRDRLQQEFDYHEPLRFGAAGGIATPSAVLAAFELGAAYVLTGTVNQPCLESGSSDLVRQLLADAEQADVVMAPAADMFEMGVRLQVLKRGTLFAPRAQRLYELYRAHDSIAAIPREEREKIESTIFRMPLEEVWKLTQEFWRERDAGQLERAAGDEKHRMALVFRWYLGLSSQWANRGVAERQADFQVWCGPAMGAFNEWVKGSYLEDWRERRVEDVALNLMHGAAVKARLNQLERQGLRLRSLSQGGAGVDLGVCTRPQRRAVLERFLS